MFTKIPEDLESLSADQLRDLRKTIAGEVKAALAADDRTAETVAAAKAALADANKCAELAATKDAEAQAEQETADALAEAEALAADDEEVEPEVDEVDEEVEEVDQEKVPVEAAVTPEEAPVNVPAVPARTQKVRTGVGVDAKPESEASGTTRITVDKVLAGEGVKGRELGSQFENWGEVAQGIVEKASNLRANADGKYEVAYIPATGPRIELDPDPYMNLHLFDDNELKAALCTAPEPVYDMSCWNSDRRPVFNSLATFQPSARGSVSVYPSPTLQDITTGYGQWTFDDDDGETEKTCATIECGTPEVYEWYAIYRCLTIKHSMLMTFPELVEAWLNRLAAATARYAETLMLEAMATSADTVTMPTLGYGASTSVTTGLLNYLALYQEQQRWDAPMMDAWLHRWWLYAAKADMMRRRTTSGRISVPSDAEVTALFRENGIEPHFFIDNPSWATDIPQFTTSGLLGQFPRNLEVLVAPRGKFAKFDRGRLSIGVTGNNMYRDTTNLRRNEITFFVESYEGTVDTNSCPAHLLQFNNLCYNGQQIADLVINCEGGDEVGAAS